MALTADEEAALKELLAKKESILAVASEDEKEKAVISNEEKMNALTGFLATSRGLVSVANEAGVVLDWKPFQDEFSKLIG